MNFTEDFFNLVLDFEEEWGVKSVELDHKKQHVYLNLEYVSEYLYKK